MNKQNSNKLHFHKIWTSHALCGFTKSTQGEEGNVGIKPCNIYKNMHNNGCLKPHDVNIVTITQIKSMVPHNQGLVT